MEELDAEDVTEAELWELATSVDKEERATALHTLATLKQGRGEMAESLSEAATARELFVELAMPQAEASSGWYEARALNAQESYLETITVLDRTIELYRSYSGEIELADAISLQAKAFASLERKSEAENGFRSAIELYKSNDCFQQAGYYTLAIGDLQGSENRQREALATYEEAVVLCRQAADLMGVARAHNSLSDIVFDLGDTDKAIVHLRDALNILKFMENDDAWPHVQYRLGMRLMLDGEQDEAASPLEETSRFYKAAGNYGKAAESDHQRAHALINGGDADEEKARALYRTVRGVFVALGMSEDAWVAELNIAESYRRTDMPHEAIEIYRTVLEQSTAANHSHWMRSTTVDLAWALASRGAPEDFDEALELLEGVPTESWGNNVPARIEHLKAFSYVLDALGRGEESEEYEELLQILDPERE